MRKSLLQSLGPTLTRKLPFTFVFGNHDDAEGKASTFDKSDVYAELLRHTHFIGGDQHLNISGIGNHVIKISGEQVLFSHSTLSEITKTQENCTLLVFLDSGMIPDEFGRDDFVKKDQVDWLEGEIEVM